MAKIDLKAYKSAIHATAKVGNNRTTTHNGASRINRLHGHAIMTVDYTQKRATLDACGYLTTTTVAAMKEFLEAETGLVWRVSRAGGKLRIDGGIMPAPRESALGLITVDLP